MTREKDYIRKKADTHKVRDKYLGKNMFFEVESCTGNTYTVNISVDCDCTYISNVGNKAKICSHIYAALKKMQEKLL